MYNEILNRNTVSKIEQLRTGHCGLNYYLHRLGITSESSANVEVGNKQSIGMPEIQRTKENTEGKNQKRKNYAGEIARNLIY